MRIELISDLDDDTYTATRFDGCSFETGIIAKKHSINPILMFQDCIALGVQILTRCFPSTPPHAQLAIFQKSAMLPNNAPISPLEGSLL